MTYLADHTYSKAFIKSVDIEHVIQSHRLDKCKTRDGKYEFCQALACRACLVTGVQLCSLRDTGLAQVFSELSGLPVKHTDIFPKLICGMCLHTLRKLMAFKRRCHSAMYKLQQMDAYKMQITTQSLATLKYEPTCNLMKTNVKMVSIGDDNLGPSTNIYNAIDTDDDYYFNGDIEEFVHNDIFENIIHEDPSSCITGPLPFKSLSTQTEIQPSIKKINQHASTDNISTVLNNGDIRNYLNSFKHTDISTTKQKNKDTEAILPLNEHNKQFDNLVEANSRDSFDTTIKQKSKKEYSCKSCFKKFNQRQNLENHKKMCTSLSYRRVVQDKQEKYACNICNKTFSRKSYIEDHHKVHTKPYTCHICNTAFSQKKLLSRHHIRKHTSEKPYHCHICPKAFCLKDDLSKHKKTHTTEKPFPCDLCPKTFSRNWLLKQHKKVHLGEKSYTCNICNRSFVFKQQLKNHSSTHTGEKNYTCNICNKSFRLKPTLLRHKIYHSDVRPYSCDTCGMTYRYSHTLADHVNYGCKISKSRLCCNICNREYKTKSSFNWHRKHCSISPTEKLGPMDHGHKLIKET